ncbi:MAG: hypothetical protein IPL40_11925 [Proteobacteria bacterium]|nr:hypothetical protein [Pseudomonadota bacterium]
MMARCYSSAWKVAVVGVVLVVAALPAPARAKATAYVALPQEGDRPTKLKIRLLRYEGGTNGKALVELKNTGQAAEVFVATGLYLVPAGAPGSAPQRLGAAGPFEVERAGGWQAEEQLKVAPGASERLRLQVFCIDSHRASPGQGQGFKVGKTRLPADLSSKITARTKAAIAKNGGRVEAAINEIQGEVWKARNEAWVPLDGERPHEKGSPPPSSATPSQGTNAPYSLGTLRQRARSSEQSDRR